MSLLESIFYMMWRGVAIGVLISAPMGPVGILCIQRTLDKGRKAGFYTGIGAALSDLFYCLLTGFGLSFIEEFLERNSSVIQLVGSIVLIAFSAYLFKKNPTRQLKRPVDGTISPHKSILGGFLFTFSNPLILFLIIGLFARFNFLMPEIKFYHYLVGFIFILGGALGWWWIVTFFIDKVRAHFNLRSMWLINRIIGGIILIFAIVGIVSAIMDISDGDDARGADIYLNPRRGFSTLRTDSLSSSMELPAGNEDFSLTCRMQTAGPGGWTLSFVQDSLRAVDIRFLIEEFDDGVSVSDRITIAASEGSRCADSPPPVIASRGIPCSHTLSPHLNCYNISRTGRHWQVSAGVFRLKPLLEFDVDGDLDIDRLGLSHDGSLSLTPLEFVIHTQDPPLTRDSQSPWRDSALLEMYLSDSRDPLEGYWQILDRNLDESLLKLGGDYRFALVRSLDGYDLLYLQGAQTNRDLWLFGDRKAHLSPSGIEGIWDVTWFDSQRLPLDKEIKAQRSEISTLSIQFPYQASSLRLQRTGPDGF